MLTRQRRFRQPGPGRREFWIDGRVLIGRHLDRPVWLTEPSGLSWPETARRLGTHPVTMRRWRFKGVRPNVAHQAALLELADGMGLGHLLTE